MPTPFGRRVATIGVRGYDHSMEPPFEEMTPAERILYLQDLWDRITEEPEGVPLSEAQRLELRRRVEQHQADPGAVVPWELVLAKARAR